jgi:hypothetical protein
VELLYTIVGRHDKTYSSRVTLQAPAATVCSLGAWVDRAARGLCQHVLIGAGKSVMYSMVAADC